MQPVSSRVASQRRLNVGQSMNAQLVSLPLLSNGGSHAANMAAHASSSAAGQLMRRPSRSSSSYTQRVCASLNGPNSSIGRGHQQRPAAASLEAAPTEPAAAAGAAAAPAASMSSVLSSMEEAIAPDEFELPPGVLSEVDRTMPLSADDVFRCPGCTRAECMTPRGCADTLWRFEPDGYLRAALTARVYDVAVVSPLERAAKLSDALGNNVLIKREDLQPVFSFKLRGAYNKMAKLAPEQLARGVITSSAGNHAQGVALAAQKLGCKATICMPVTTPDIKVANVRRLGGTVELVGETYQEAQAHALKRAVEEGLTFVAPYDDPYTIAGQATIGDEILRQVSNPAELDAIFVAVGGGGLIAGIAAYVKALHPHVQVIGVEPSGANAMAASLARGARVTLSRVDGFADGVAVKRVGAETFRVCRDLVDGVVLVDNAAVSGAIKDVFNETRSILEPAGAVAIAGAKAWLKQTGRKGATVVAVASGANINFERLRLVSELADLGTSTEVMMATQIPEQPGAFREFVRVATGVTGSGGEASTSSSNNGDSSSSSSSSSSSQQQPQQPQQQQQQQVSVTEFKYRYSAGATASILWSAGVPDRQAGAALAARLNAAGMPTRDISDLDAAQIHLRHLVGGRARSYMGELPHERMLQVQFPERPGALAAFLDALSPAWNVTLFHYRQTGNSTSYVLLGIQVPPEAEAEFRRAQRQLRREFTFEEITGETRDVMNMFIQ